MRHILKLWPKNTAQSMCKFKENKNMYIEVFTLKTNVRAVLLFKETFMHVAVLHPYF